MSQGLCTLIMARIKMSDREAYEDYMLAQGIDGEIEISLLRRTEDGRWRAAYNGGKVWGDTPADALEVLARELRS